ncbi:Vacuolar protein sorting-associated protein 35 [Tritrichomonas musculus]|uniref:Vacuolar protein sorting-associated protein 35 n=1 Tax=Tritrichomonas musculus TaxID=1915356 RepID=A0ABR2IPM3_9EUKA
MTKPETELKYGQLPPDEEQEVFVKEANDRIQGYGFLMNRQFDEKNVKEGLRYATLMLEDMKTSVLTPVRYNDLYITILSHLSSLALAFKGDERKLFSSRDIAELYETVQYTPSIVPRLYLLFTVAPAFIKYEHAKACDVMRDLIEMARGVQHPTRALFLRYYLLHIMKDVLPDSRNTEGGDIEDSLKFILENFKQMNVLWVRLEFSLDTKTVEERKLQRSQLKQLVGSNIQRLSMLNGLELTHYKDIILPCVVEQITACREPLAQYYIIEIITQVFPAEYHIETLETLFEVLMKLEDEVSTLSLVTSIIKRLQTYFTAQDSDKAMAIKTVKLVAQQIDQLLQAGQHFSLEDTLEMLGTLLNFTLEVDPNNTSNVNSILHFVENHIDGIYGDARLDNPKVSMKLRFFLVTPLREMKDASMLFELDYFPALVNRMRYNDRKSIALEVCNGFSRTEALIDDTNKLKSFFNIIQVLLQEPSDYEEDPEDPISYHLQAVARVFHLIKSESSIDTTFQLLTSVSATIQKLSNEVKENLYLSLGQSILKIAVDIDAQGEASKCQTTVRNVLQHIYSLLSKDNGDPPPLPSFWIYLEATKISDRCGTAAITTEFFVSSIKIWKDGVFESGQRFRMLISMIRTATELINLPASAYISITSELCNNAGGLLQKDQQAEAHILCSHMFNVDREENQSQNEEEDEDEEEAFKSPDKIKNCLVRALKAASTMMDQIEQLPWFYQVLGHAIYFLENGVELPVDWFNALTQKIDEQHRVNSEELETKLSPENRQFYMNLIRHKDSVIHFE